MNSVFFRTKNYGFARVWGAAAPQPPGSYFVRDKAPEIRDFYW